MSFDLTQLAEQKIYIFGLGREGYSTYQFLRKRLPEKKLILVDDKPVGKLKSHWLEVADNPYSSFTTSGSLEFEQDTKAIIFKTPGIRPDHSLLQQAVQAGATISSNTSLFFQLVAQLHAKGKNLTTIGVTGTKGKSTASSAIYHLLNTGGSSVALGGNIGVPPLDLLVDEAKIAEILVLELSSHQLSELEYSPNYAVVLEITPEHLDYYPDFATYAEAKSQIVRFQTEADFVVFNPVFTYPAEFARLSKGKKLPFGDQEAEFPPPESFIEHNAIFYQNEEIADLDELALKGKHSYLNLLPAVVVGKRLGLSSLNIRQGLQTFKPLEHRLEVVAEAGGVTYVNDSLSTTPEAAIAAIRSFPEKQVILIAGGHERQQDFSELAAEITSQQVKALLYFEPTGKRLVKEIEKSGKASELIIEKAESMDAAVKIASALAAENSVVLLSPASASFGSFRDYQDRGNQFKAAVEKFSAK